MSVDVSCLDRVLPERVCAESAIPLVMSLKRWRGLAAILSCLGSAKSGGGKHEI